MEVSGSRPKGAVSQCHPSQKTWYVPSKTLKNVRRTAISVPPSRETSPAMRRQARKKKQKTKGLVKDLPGLRHTT